MPVVTVAAQIRDLVKYPALPVVADSLDVVEVTPTDTSGIEFVSTGREIVLARNTSGGALTVTLVSAADPQGRTGDVGPYSIGAGELAVLAPPQLGFVGTGGKITVACSGVGVHFHVIRTSNPIW